MKAKKEKYNLPAGYSFLESVIRSKDFLKHPIQFIEKTIAKFPSGTYSSSAGLNTRVIVTQNPGFINYILRENHKNYSKSAFSEKASKFFGKGLLYANGDEWLRQRRLIQPGFHKEKIQGLYNIVHKTINDFLLSFPVGEKVDVYPVVHQLSFNILIKSLFDIDLSSKIMAELEDIFRDLQDFLLTDINQSWRRLFYPLTGTLSANQKKAKRLREIIIGIIRQRKASSQSYSDLLDMLLNSRYEDTMEAMSEEQLIDELLILILAGYETTGNSLAWLLYLIASNPEKKKKLLSSLEGISIHDSVNNEYLKAAINEGIRLFPAAWMTDRVAIEDDGFADYTYPKDTIIIPFFYGLHRDKTIWEDAEEFKPERFLPDQKAAKLKNFFPFGAGPRMCIGNNFAMAEMSFFLYAFFKEFQISPGETIPQLRPLLTLRPDNIFLNISRINH